MSDRTTLETVSFHHPFSLTATDDPISAGSYVVETIEETIEGATFVGYRRISTTITIASKSYGGAARQVIEIDPVELENALKCDKERQVISAQAKANAAAVGHQD
jgi:Flp pilus assembly protein TadB